MSLKNEIINLLKLDVLSVPEMTEMLGNYDSGTIRKAVRQLRDDGYIVRCGGDKKTNYWKIVENKQLPVKVKRAVPVRPPKEFKQKISSCHWSQVPKTDYTRGYGYVIT